MSIEPPIATKRLRATWSDGSLHDVLIQIWRPYPDDNIFRCKIQAHGLQQDYSPPDLSGSDEMHALNMSLQFVRFLLEWHVEAGGRLFYPPPNDETPYTPIDLPKIEDDDTTAS